MEWWPWEVHHQARSISCLPARSMVMTVFSHSANVLMAFSHISHRSSIPILRSSPSTNYYRDKSWSPTNKYQAVTFNLGWSLFSKLRVFSCYLRIYKIIRKSRSVTWIKVLWSLNQEYLENPWALKFYIWEPSHRQLLQTVDQISLTVYRRNYDGRSYSSILPLFGFFFSFLNGKCFSFFFYEPTFLTPLPKALKLTLGCVWGFGVWTMDYGYWAMAPLLRSQG